MDSILLQKQVRDNAKDLQDFCKELKEWGDEIKKKDESLKRSPNNQPEVSLPKNKVSKISEFSKEKNKKEHNITQNKRIKGCDYAAWEKFDADAHCAKLDSEHVEENSSTESELSDELDESAIDLANAEKEKGNAYVKKQQWDQAIKCYTQAIECYAYDPIYYANRALCYLKKEEYRYAETDCTTALQLDKTYVKAYQRRAAARENLNQLSEAQSDLLRVLELEQKNKESRTALKRVEKKLENTKQEKVEISEPQRPVSKFTLSRQKHKNSSVESQLQNEGVKKDLPAISEHIIERVTPLNPTDIIKQKSSIHDEHKIKPQHSNFGGIDRKLETSKNISPVAELPKDLLSRHNSSDITLFNSIYKSPKTRSKNPLKRIQIIDVDLKTEKSYLPSRSTFKNQENMVIKTVIENETNTPNKNVEVHASKKGDSFDRLNISSPKTAVQFYNTWESIRDKKEWQKLYLQKINPNDLSMIFKESLESKVFSNIIEVLNDSCKENQKHVYEYLLGLTSVKRFATIIMFMSTKDKENLLSIIDQLKQDNKYAATDIDKLINLYEL